MKERSAHINDDLLVRHLLGEGPELAAEVEQWCNASTTNQRYFEHFRLIWDQSRKLASQSTVDEEAAWQRLTARITDGARMAPVVPLRKRKLNRVRAAAAILLLAAGSCLAYFLSSGDKAGRTTLYADKQVLTDTLPDGSVVTLNKNAAVSFRDAFEGSARNVTLQGEAFFDVAPQEQKPFVIRVEDVEIKVLGTSFNVRNSNGRTEIVVETGAVQITDQQHQPVLAGAHEKVIIGKGQAPVKEPNTDKLYRYYRTKEFVCNNTPLWRLAAVLEEAYNVRIIIESERLKQMPITTTFRNERLDNILHIISETFNTRIEQDDNRIYIR